MYHSVNPQTVESAFSWLHASQSGQSVSKLASQSASQSVSQPFSKSVGQLVIHSVSQSVSQSLASWAVSHSASKSVGQLASQSVSQWAWLYEPQCRLHVWSNPHSVLHLFIFHVKIMRTLNKAPTTAPTKFECFYGFQISVLQNFERDFSDQPFLIFQKSCFW